MRLVRVLGLAVIAVLLLAAPAIAADTPAPTASDIAEGLVCQCGCNLVLLNCSHVECSSRTNMNLQIQDMLNQGQTADQIVRYFVTQYGEQVLAAPTKKGFNMTAWLLPPVAIIFGGGTIYAVLKKWVRRGCLPQAVPTADETDDRYAQQVEKELKEYSDRGYR